MEHSRVRSVGRAGFPHGEQNEGTTSAKSQVEKPEQSCKGNAHAKLEIQEDRESAQDLESGGETQTRSQAQRSREKEGEQGNSVAELGIRTQGRFWRGQLHAFA